MLLGKGKDAAFGLFEEQAGFFVLSQYTSDQCRAP